jgi:hypothetical protein
VGNPSNSKTAVAASFFWPETAYAVLGKFGQKH